MSLTQRKIEILQAFEKAQSIAFAPFVFQAVAAAKDCGLLQALGESDSPLPVSALAQNVALSENAVTVLCDILESSEVIERDENHAYRLSRVGECLIYDQMTEVNFDFSNLVNYAPLKHTLKALQSGKPAGLKEYDETWTTIYPHLKDLPQKSRRAWFAFDHFHSDSAYQAALNILKDRQVRYFVDIGGNTGRFTKKALATWQDSRACIVDLPEQIGLMRQNTNLKSLQNRIDTVPINWLDPDAQPLIKEKVDLIWMSQFLDCFSRAEAVSILKRAKNLARQNGAMLAILEPLVDHQRNRAATLSIACSSLYFSCLANGNSKFFSSEELRGIIDESGLVVESVHEPIGVGHSLYICG